MKHTLFLSAWTDTPRYSSIRTLEGQLEVESAEKGEERGERGESSMLVNIARWEVVHKLLAP
jgi:hypothetical protein